MLIRFALVITAMLLLVSVQADAQTTWFKYEGNPVLTLGASGTWDQECVLASGVIFKDSLYRMWYAGVSAGIPKLGYATSPDGVTWNKYASNPVLIPGPSWELGGVVNDYVLPEDTVYRMWYNGFDIYGDARLCYATSPDGVVWTKYAANPILWQATWFRQIYQPSILPAPGGTYHMWFCGDAPSGLTQIGYAQGSSPTSWAPNANPVVSIGSLGSWKSAGVFAPRVLPDGQGGFQMWYAGNRGTIPTNRFGYATSPDGINWTDYPRNPVFSGAPGQWDAGGINNPNVLFDGAIYHMWYNGGDWPAWRAGYAVSPKGFSASIYPTIPSRVGDTVWVRVQVADGKDLSFKARLNGPSGLSLGVISLFDDGQHHDGLAGDGVFANGWVPVDVDTYYVDVSLRLRGTLPFDYLSNVATFSAWLPQFPADTVHHSAGGGDGSLAIYVLDSVQARQHHFDEYRVTFKDSALKASHLSVYNLTHQLPVIQEEPIGRRGSNGVNFDGFRLEIMQPEQTTFCPDTTQSRWLQHTSNLRLDPLITVFTRADNSIVWGIPYPADYLISVSDHVVDTSVALYGAPTVPVKFTVTNVMENRKVKFLFLDQNSDGQVGANDEIVVLERPRGSSADTLVAWDLRFTLPGGTAVLPQPGDAFFAKFLKPFGSLDTLRFTAFVTGIGGGQPGSLPGQFCLEQNYPNPFNPATRIQYTVGETREAGRGTSNVRLVVHDLLGREVVVLVDEKKVPGSYEVTFDGTNLSTGVYFYRLTAGDYVATKKLLLLK